MAIYAVVILRYVHGCNKHMTTRQFTKVLKPRQLLSFQSKGIEAKYSNVDIRTSHICQILYFVFVALPL